AALAVILAVPLSRMAARQGWPLWPTVGVATALAVALEPTRETLGFGQVNLLLFALVMADLVGMRLRSAAVLAARRGGADPGLGGFRGFWLSGAWAGAGIGLATAVKLTPGLFIVYLLVSRQRRAAAVASVTAAAASLA